LQVATVVDLAVAARTTAFCVNASELIRVTVLAAAAAAATANV
jgi:hypothetical protein